MFYPTNSEIKNLVTSSLTTFLLHVEDGSINNNLALSGFNFSDYALNRQYKLPILFVISNNNICISLENYDFLSKFLEKEKTFKKIFKTDGMNILYVFNKTKQAINFTRNNMKPTILLVENLPRRFGHAATDRQNAYFSETLIQQQADLNPIINTIELLGLNKKEILEELEFLENKIEETFEEIIKNEKKIEKREETLNNLHQPLSSIEYSDKIYNNFYEEDKLKFSKRPSTMRENMTQIYDELLSTFKQTTYIGEDIRHGGYYLVTNDLYKKHKERVIDIPPDETLLAAFGIGFSQCGLFPIIEYPYAKYLDCGADMFFESILTNWCTNGKQKNGILYRLQGFDSGIFGGNFHTHNSIYTPPGLDIVCYSNGEDYVKGIRYSFQQTINGRIVMSIDSTNLLNKRNKFWMHNYPAYDNNKKEHNYLAFDDIICYIPTEDSVEKVVIKRKKDLELKRIKNKEKLIIVYTFGNGVHAALEAVEGFNKMEKDRIIVLDAPYLSDIPKQFVNLLKAKENEEVSIVFADVCKSGSSVLSQQIMRLKQNDFLNKNINWSFLAAANTYNPLGTTLTFLSADDISKEIRKFI